MRQFVTRLQHCLDTLELHSLRNGRSLTQQLIDSDISDGTLMPTMMQVCQGRVGRIAFRQFWLPLLRGRRRRTKQNVVLNGDINSRIATRKNHTSISEEESDDSTFAGFLIGLRGPRFRCGNTNFHTWSVSSGDFSSLAKSTGTFRSNCRATFFLLGTVTLVSSTYLLLSGQPRPSPLVKRCREALEM